MSRLLHDLNVRRTLFMWIESESGKKSLTQGRFENCALPQFTLCALLYLSAVVDNDEGRRTTHESVVLNYEYGIFKKNYVLFF